MRFGIDFGGTNLKTGLFTEQGEIIKFEENKLSKFTNQGNLLKALIKFSRDFIEGFSVTKGGLAIKGLVNTYTGYVMEDIGAGELLAGINLAKVFSESLNIPFIIENDARAYALGEWKFGAGRNTDNMVCITLGTGLGCAAIVNGQPFRGADVFGGLLGGHISIDRNGPECSCGNRGCLELYCSATALNARVKKNHPELNIYKEALPRFFEKVKENKFYRTTLEKFQDDLAIGIVNLIHAYNPDLVVLGGGVLKSSNLIMPRLIEIVHRRAWTYPRGKVQIKASELGNKAAALGVAFHPELENK